MTREYGKRHSTRRKGGVSKQLLVLVMGFLAGYVTASVFDFTSLTHWVNAQLAQHQTQPMVKAPIPQAQIPKPKFEFYTLLANEHAHPTQPTSNVAPATANAVPVLPQVATKTTSSDKETVLPALPTTSLAKDVTSSKEGYVVQIAAFKRKQEADSMKASLALKGFVVSILMVTQQHTQWYRVNLGPFASRSEAEKAQVLVARSQHIVGMIRKMDA